MPDLCLPARSAALPRFGLARLLAAPLLCTLLAVGCSGGNDGAISQGPDPVVPSDPDSLPPQVLEWINQHVEEVRKDPGSADKHGALGLTYEANDLWHEALGSFENARTLGPQTPLWFLHEAIAQSVLGDVDGAVTTLQAGVELHPDYAPMQDRLGELQLSRGMIASARDAFQAAAKLAPQAAEPLVGLGDLALTEGNAGAAIDVLQRAVELDPGYRAAHLILGMAYREAGRSDEAQRELAAGEGGSKRYMPDEGTRQLTMLSVTRTNARLDSTRMLNESRAQEAIDLLQPLVQRYPDDVRLRVNLALAEQRLGKSDQALAELSEAEGIDPEFAMVPYNLAVVCMNLGRYEEAVTHAERALTLADKLAPAHLVRARALLALGRPKQAAAAAQAAIQVDQRQAPAALEILGEIAESMGQADQAHQAYLQAAKIAENDGRPWPGIFRYAVRTRDAELADQALTTLKRLDPQYAGLEKMQQDLDALRKP